MIQLPMTKRKKKKPWMTENILNLMDDRRKVKNTDEHRYQEINKRIRKECLLAKEEWMDENCTKIEQMAKCNAKEMYANINKAFYKRKRRNQNNTIMNKHGKILMDSAEVKARWEEYIKELYDDTREQIVCETNNEGPEILKEEIRKAMNNMKNGKAIGTDGIAKEIIEALGEKGVDILTEIANKIYENGATPNQMRETIMIKIPKVEGTLKCEQHRTISIINHITKIILKVITERIKSRIRPEMAKEQFGFVANSGTTNAIFTLNRIIENAIQVQKNVYLCFVDYEKAFDKVRHNELMNILKQIGVDGKDLRLIKNIYEMQRVALQLGGELTDWIDIKRGVRQGCVMSPDLFNIYAEIIMRNIEEEGIRVGGKNINNIRYADDTVLMADSEEKLKALVQKVSEHSEAMGIKINRKKTKTMVITEKDRSPTIRLRINNDEIEQVDNFVYLGSLINWDGRQDKEIRRRIAIAYNNMRKLRKLITNKKISMTSRKRIVKCYIWSTLLYGCETWNINNQTRMRLEAFEMKIWRYVLKVSWTQRITNEEILRRMGTQRELMTTIYKGQLRFVGHMERKEGLKSLCMVGMMNGRRGRGRPRKSYTDSLIEITGRNHSMVELRRMMRDRSLWRSMVAHVRLDMAPQ